MLKITFSINREKCVDQNGGKKMTRESEIIKEKMDDWNQR